jgi:predicted nucleic acid-binding protein
LEVSALQAFLRRHQRIALDTSVFIYALEEHPRYADLADEVLKWVERPGHSAVTSTITITEILTKPYGTVEEQDVSYTYDLLTGYPNLTWVPVDLEVAHIAARLRAEYRLKTADALQVATAFHSGATALVTNDATFQRVRQIETLLLDRLL